MPQPPRISFGTDEPMTRGRRRRAAGLTGLIMLLSGGLIRTEASAKIVLLIIGALAAAGNVYFLLGDETPETGNTIEITPGESVGIPQNEIRSRNR